MVVSTNDLHSDEIFENDGGGGLVFKNIVSIFVSDSR